jgi:aminoglycoside phosphotransferase (APT) family kinase protein
MHDDEAAIDRDLVRRLVARQLPQWAELSLEPVVSGGTDNALYRLGEDLVVRLPRIHWAVDDVEKEQTWLPRLAPSLPVETPTPVALGEPGEGYPWCWSVYRWVVGDVPVVGRIGDPERLASELGRFVRSMHQVDANGGPASSRGGHLAERQEATQEAIDALDGLADATAARAAWAEALSVPPWPRSKVWIHGDLAPGNLILREGRLRGVIDFGAMGLGDPAVDLVVAWNLLPARARRAFRHASGADAATWARGRGWALSIALIQLPYYHRTNPALAGNARHVIEQVLRDRSGVDDLLD